MHFLGNLFLIIGGVLALAVLVLLLLRMFEELLGLDFAKTKYASDIRLRFNKTLKEKEKSFQDY